MIKTISMILKKYPLSIPYLLDRRLSIPEISPVLKKANVVHFIDFLLIGGSASEFATN